MRKIRSSGKAAATASLISQRRGKVGAERLFEPDAGVAAGQADAAQAGDGGLEQARRGRQEDRQLVVRPDLGGELFKAFGRGDVERLVAQAVEEVGHRPAALRREEFLQRLAGELAEILVAHLRTGGADDAQVLGEQLVVIERGQRREQHAPGKIARGAEQDQRVGCECHSYLLIPQLGRAAMQHGPRTRVCHETR